MAPRRFTEGILWLLAAVAETAFVSVAGPVLQERSVAPTAATKRAGTFHECSRLQKKKHLRSFREVAGGHGPNNGRLFFTCYNPGSKFRS